MHPARLWKPLSEAKVRCGLCCHFCVIDPGGRGRCGVRTNQGGKLFTLVYDRVAALNIDPIEKKPLYHFLPGTSTFSLGTMGCNLECSFCQNASLSQPPRLGQAVEGRPVTPEGLVEAAQASGCRSISYTYSEPTIFFELVQDTSRLAREAGLANILVTNGFMSPECLDELGPLVQAANVDLKAFTPAFYESVCGARLEPVKKNLARMRALGWWLEVTTLVIPGLNDSREELTALARFLAGELGPDTPWHLSRFHPDYRMLDRGSTPADTLEMAWDIGRREGLRFVYLGNIRSRGRSDTLCPACGALLVERDGFSSTVRGLAGGRCASCGAALPGRFDRV